MSDQIWFKQKQKGSSRQFPVPNVYKGRKGLEDTMVSAINILEALGKPKKVVLQIIPKAAPEKRVQNLQRIHLIHSNTMNLPPIGKGKIVNLPCQTAGEEDK